MSVLSRRLRETRRRLGLKQDELAQAIGVTQGTISRWERGDPEPDFAAMRKVAELAGLDPFKFILDDEEHPFLTSDWGMLVQVVGQISENVWIEDPKWDASQIFQVQIPTLKEWEGMEIEGFVISDDNCEPIYKKRSIVFVSRHKPYDWRLWADDYVVIVRQDERGLFEVVLRQVYINHKGEVYFVSLNDDPSIGQAFKLQHPKDTTVGGSENVLKIHESAIRGTVIASFRVEAPDLRITAQD